EIQRIRALGALGKTIFVFPPVAERELRLRLDVVSRALDLQPGVVLPVYPGGRFLMVLRFDEDGSPVVTVGGRRSDIGYQAAIEDAARACGTHRPTPVFGPSPAALLTTPQSGPAVLPISPSPAMLRKRRRRRWFTVL